MNVTVPGGVDGLLAIEMGGTTSRAAMVRPSGVSRVVRMSNAPLAGAPAFEPALRGVWRKLAADAGCAAPSDVVLALPGPVYAGKVAALPTLTGGSRFFLDAASSAAAVWPAARLWICNDLTLAGFGQITADRRDFLITTIGSGIGSKLFIGGTPLTGRAGMGGEIGHWTVPGAPPLECDCGGRGHLGAVASGRGIIAWFRRRAVDDPRGFQRSALSGLDRLDAAAIVAAYHEDDRWTAATMEMPTQALAHAFGLIHLATGTELFLLTGGMGGALGEKFCYRLADHCRSACWDTGLDWHRSVRCIVDADEATLRGAALYAAVTNPDRDPADEQ